MFKMATPTVIQMLSSNCWRRKRQRSIASFYQVRLTAAPRLVEFVQLLCKQRYEGWRRMARSSDKECKFQVA